MSDPHDVSMHFSELKRQLQADGFDDTTPIGEVLIKLHSSLLEDGFDMEPQEALSTMESETANEEATVESTSDNLLLTLKDAFASSRTQNTDLDSVVLPPVTLQAFRTFSALDADLLKDFLLSQWCRARVFSHKDRYFVVASNADITDGDVKKALQDYVSKAKV